MATQAKHGASRLRWAVWGSAAFLLLLPLIAMQFSREVKWSPADFAIFGAMLVCACGAYELATRMNENLVYRAAAGLAIATGFVLVWMNLAVGVIGAEDNPANLMYAAVLAIAAAGALIARFRPEGMARALAATALAQAAVAVIALVAGFGEALILNAAFVALWLGSAWLFRKAGQEQTLAGPAL